MTPSPSRRVLRVTAAAVLLACSVGVAVASADDLPTSTPEVFRASTDVDDLAAAGDGAGGDGAGVTVAVIDTGVADVPAMDGTVVHQENFSAAPDDGDQYGHGTFVAGLVHEVAPGAQIVSVKLSGANGAVDVTQVLAALQWVVANKDRYSIDVVNLSFGNDSRQSAATSPLNYAVQQAWDAGLVVVASAGNLGANGSGSVTKPGDDPVIISVGASDDAGTGWRGDDVVAGYSGRGPSPDGLAKPDLVAPGTRVVSVRAPGSTVDVEHPEARIGDDHFRGSGTSFAAPITAGVVAVMLGIDPSLDPDQVKYGLLRTARSIDDDPNADGAGTIRALRAVEVAREGRANRGVGRSSGTGSLQAARGSAIVQVRTRAKVALGLVADVTVPVVGERTAEVPARDADAPNLVLGDVLTDATDSFDRVEFRDGSDWDASHWGASQWGASQWGASHWGASQWGASQWGSSQWWASQWG